MIQIYMEYFLTDQNSQVILIDCIHGISNHDVPVIWNHIMIWIQYFMEFVDNDLMFLLSRIVFPSNELLLF